MRWSREFRTALYALDGVGTKTYVKALKTLSKHELDESDFWVNKWGIWDKIPFNKKIENSIYKFKKEYNQYSYYQKIIEKNIRVVFEDDQEYPFLLKQIDFSPPVLFIKGAPLKTTQPISVVGTRKITAYGKHLIDHFVPFWSQTREIVSGFMYGVDVHAQKKVLESGGYTIGVLGFGFDYMYPSHQRSLMKEFLAKGASFVSPFAPHVAPRPGNFPARNVLIAGMSLGVCVIEAAAKSGSLFTARLAGEMGREVWTIPGSIFSPFSAGVQTLLQEGAMLLRSPEDLEVSLKKVGNNFRSKGEVEGQTLIKEKVKSKISREEVSRNYLDRFNLTDKEKVVLEVLQAKKHNIDELLAKTDFSLLELQEVLLGLQLKSLVEEKGLWWVAGV